MTGAENKKLVVTSSRTGIASVTKLPNGNYRVTGIAPGITYIVFDVYDGGARLTHASIKVNVQNGASPGGLAGRTTSYF